MSPPSNYSAHSDDALLAELTRRALGVAKTGPLPQDNIVAMYVALTLVLLFARIFGEISKKFGQPAVMGELLAGIFLGRTVLLQVSPSTFNYLFNDGKTTTGFTAITSFCVTFYLLVSGLEMSVSTMTKKRKAAMSVGFFGLIIPFSIGFGVAMASPDMMGRPSFANTDTEITNFAFFCAVAMSITALPVAAKTLRDMQLYRTDLGVIVISAAVQDDLLGWSLFAVVLSMSSGSTGPLGLAGGIMVSLIYIVLMLTVGTWLVNKMLPFIQAYLSFPAGELGFVCLFTLASAAFALWIGLHNTIGAFLVGAAIGNSKYFRVDMRETIDTFVTYLLSPLFFGSVCIPANFIKDFDAGVVFLIFFVACVGKMVGGFLGARLAKSSVRESLAIAVCMNARGAMEIILATIALEARIIDGKMFVALVFMAIVTSLMPGPLLRLILRRPKIINILSFVHGKGFFPRLQGVTMQETIKFMCSSIGHTEFAGPLIEAELSSSTVADFFVAIPRVSLSSLTSPVVLFGVSPEGVFFPNNVPVKYIVVLVTPENSDLELDLLRAVNTLTSSESFLAELGTLSSHVELLASIQIHKYRLGLAADHEPGYVQAPAIAGGGTMLPDFAAMGSPALKKADPETEEPDSLPSFLASAGGATSIGARAKKDEERDEMLPERNLPVAKLSRRGTSGDNDMQLANV